MDNKTFIGSLNVGDLVAVCSSGYSGPNYKISKVEEINTRAGKRTYIIDGCKYDNDGYEKLERSRDNTWTRRKTIRPITDEIRASIKRRRDLASVESVTDWSALSDDKIARIAAILKE